jgi:hypothetical protein
VKPSQRRLLVLAAGAALAGFVWWALRAPPVPVEIGTASPQPSR